MMAETSHAFAFGQNLSWTLHDKEPSPLSASRTPSFDNSFFPKAPQKSVLEGLPYPGAIRASGQRNRDSQLSSKHSVKTRKDFVVDHAFYGIRPETRHSIAEPPINDFFLSLAQVAAQQIRQVYRDVPSSVYPNRRDCNNNLQEAFAGGDSSRLQNGASGPWTTLINSAGYSMPEDASPHGAEQGSYVRAVETSPLRPAEVGIEARHSCIRVQSQSNIHVDAEAPKLTNEMHEKLSVSASAETDVTDEERQVAATLLFMNLNRKPTNHAEPINDPVSSALEFSSGQSRTEHYASGSLLPLTYSASAPNFSPNWPVDPENFDESSSRETLYPAKAPVSFNRATSSEEQYVSSVFNAGYGNQTACGHLIENYAQSQSLPRYHQYIYTNANVLPCWPAAAENVVDATASSSNFDRDPPWQCASDLHDLHVSEKMTALNGEKFFNIGSLSSASALEQSSDFSLASGRSHGKSDSNTRPECGERDISFTGSLSTSASQLRDPVIYEKPFPQFSPTCYAPFRATLSSYDLPLLERREIRCGNEYARQPDSSGWSMESLSSWGSDHGIPDLGSGSMDTYPGLSSMAMGPFAYQLYSTAVNRREQHPTPYPVMSVAGTSAPRLSGDLSQFPNAPMSYPNFPNANASALRDRLPHANGADSRFGSSIRPPVCNVASVSDTPCSRPSGPSGPSGWPCVAQRSSETAAVGMMKEASRDGRREDASTQAQNVRVTLSSNLGPAAPLDLQVSSNRDRLLLSSPSCASSGLGDHQRHGVSVDNQLSVSGVHPELKMPSPPVMPAHVALRQEDSDPSAISNQVRCQSGGSGSTFPGAREASSVGSSPVLRANASETRDILDDFLRMPDILDEFLRMPTKSYVGLLSESSDFNALFCLQAAPPSTGPPAALVPDLALDAGAAREVEETTTADDGSCSKLEADSRNIETSRESFLASAHPLPVQRQATLPSPKGSILKANTEDDACVPVTFVCDDAVQRIKLREVASSVCGSAVVGSRFQTRRERLSVSRKSSLSPTSSVEGGDVAFGAHDSVPKVFFGKRPECTECAILDGQQACIHLERLRIMVPNLNNRHAMRLRRRSVAAFDGVSDALVGAGDVLGDVSKDSRRSGPLRSVQDFSSSGVVDECPVAGCEGQNVRAGAKRNVIGRALHGLPSRSRDNVDQIAECPTRPTTMRVEAPTDAKLASESATPAGSSRRQTSFSSEEASRIRQELAAGLSFARHSAKSEDVGKSDGRPDASARCPSSVVEHAGGQPTFPCVVTVSDGRCYYLISKSSVMSQSLLTQTLSQAIEIPKKDGTGVIRLRPVATVSGEALAPLLNWKTPSVVLGEKGEPSIGEMSSSLKRSEQSDVVPVASNAAGLGRKRKMRRYSALDLSSSIEDELEDLVTWQQQRQSGAEMLPERRRDGSPLAPVRHSVAGMASAADPRGGQFRGSEPEEASASSNARDRKIAPRRRCRSVADARMRATAGSRFSCSQRQVPKRVPFKASDDAAAMSDTTTRPPTQLASCRQSERNALTTESMAIITRFLERNQIDPKNVNIRLLPGQSSSSQAPAGFSKGLPSDKSCGASSAEPFVCGNEKRGKSGPGPAPGHCRGPVNRSDDDDSNEEDVPLSKLRLKLRVGGLPRPRKGAEVPVGDRLPPAAHRPSGDSSHWRHAVCGVAGASHGKRRKSAECSLPDRRQGPALSNLAASHVECSRWSERPAKLKKSVLPVKSKSTVSLPRDDCMICPDDNKRHLQPLLHGASCACVMCTVALEAKAALDRILDRVCVDCSEKIDSGDQAAPSWYGTGFGGFSRSRVGLTPVPLSDSCSGDIAPPSLVSGALGDASVSLAGVVVIDDGILDSSTDERPSWRMLTDDELMHFSNGDNATDDVTARWCSEKSLARKDSVGSHTRSRARSHSSCLFKSDVTSRRSSADRRFCLGLRKFAARADLLEVASKARNDNVALMDVIEGPLLQDGLNTKHRNSCSNPNESAVVEFDSGSLQNEESAAMRKNSGAVHEPSVVIRNDKGAAEKFSGAIRKKSEAVPMDPGGVREHSVATCSDSGVVEKNRGEVHKESDVMRVRKSSGEGPNCADAVPNSSSAEPDVAVAIRNDSVWASIDQEKMQNDTGDAQNGSRDAQNGLDDAQHGLGDAQNGLGDAQNGLGDAQNGLGDAQNGLGDAQNGLGDAQNGLGNAQNGLGDAKNGLGDAQNGLGDAKNGSGARTNGPGTVGQSSVALRFVSGALSRSGALPTSSAEADRYRNVVILIGDIRGKNFHCPPASATPSSAGSCDATGTRDSELLGGQAVSLSGQSLQRMMRSPLKPDDVERRSFEGPCKARSLILSGAPSESGSSQRVLTNDVAVSVDLERPLLQGGLKAIRIDSDAKRNDLFALENDPGAVWNGPGAAPNESDAPPNVSDVSPIESRSLRHSPGVMGGNVDAEQAVSDAVHIGLGMKQRDSGFTPNSLDAGHKGPGAVPNVSSVAPIDRDEMQNGPGAIRNVSGALKSGSGVARKSYGEPDRYGDVFVVLGDILGDNVYRASNRDFSRTTGAPPHGLPVKPAKDVDLRSGSPVTRTGQSVQRMMRSPPKPEDAERRSYGAACKTRPRIFSGPPPESEAQSEPASNRRLRRCKSQETSRRSSARFAP